MNTGIKNYLKETLRADVLQQQVKLRKNIKGSNSLVQSL